ncbi:MAG: carbamoyltransferase HypF [Armatimonadota bacterium]|nr:carbamoyltransferase HypF [Armatimonadota bacterium]MDR7450566.1 carbamoyltransferase HypF [Armatimonadota bacterium]MDR7466301.1 carbamoyltransferase HypF [Armatimonadota bacterium]MDR7493022.1 carbamoyltransferase HypF [Armatimonadota bacterium]MDR7498221.1 carbamoyltransferase HypF [Armatimonadota bacterium]
MTRLALDVRGAVQGVGFRPFVYRLATELGLSGWVRNGPAGVRIEVEGQPESVEAFVERLIREAPPHARILEIDRTVVPAVGDGVFVIAPSERDGAPTVVVPVDLAVCPDCLRELRDPADRRYRYPFINCTRCGPRYSIITALPYDRARTTMAAFVMCARCRAEYDDPGNRRFHAEPIACPACGPHLELWDPGGAVLAEGDQALHIAARAVRDGLIVALKGLGGFQLLVDAGNEDAVRRLRTRKGREEKPFALMYPSLELAVRHAVVSPPEEALLTSAAAPIVLLGRRPEADNDLAPSVAPGRATLGIMLPYTPLHVLLMAELQTPVVATSGNLSDEPICTDNGEACARLAGVADLFLIHDRPIARPVDDSVVRVMDGEPVVLRAARGYAPLSLSIEVELSPLVAVGGHLKNSVAVARGGEIILSQHVGDLDSARSRQVHRGTLEALTTLYDLRPTKVVCDLHPDYASTQVAEASGLPRHAVQHHQAHLLAVMAEHRLRPPVFGVAWDGTGYGPDGTVWGGEFLRLTGRGCERTAHLRTFGLPGGEAAVREPRRAALGMLYELYGDGVWGRDDLAPVRACSAAERRIFSALLRGAGSRGGLNTPRTSSAGRLFDAVASLLDLRQRAGYEGQAAAAVEDAAYGCDDDGIYPFAVQTPLGAPAVLDWGPMIEEILADLRCGTPRSTIAARFHNTLARMIVLAARMVDESQVVLSGGCFQNARLVRSAAAELRRAGFAVFCPRRVPPNDGGLAVGQALAAGEGG